MHPIADSININDKVWGVYFRVLIPQLVKEGDDGNSGSTAVCDVMCLQVHIISCLLIKFLSRLKCCPRVVTTMYFNYLGVSYDISTCTSVSKYI